jgi:hypothetical protein
MYYFSHKSRHWSLSWSVWIRSIPSHLIPLRFILILCSVLYPNLPSNLVIYVLSCSRCFAQHIYIYIYIYIYVGGGDDKIIKRRNLLSQNFKIRLRSCPSSHWCYWSNDEFSFLSCGAGHLLWDSRPMAEAWERNRINSQCWKPLHSNALWKQ